MFYVPIFHIRTYITINVFLFIDDNRENEIRLAALSHYRIETLVKRSTVCTNPVHVVKVSAGN